MDQKTVVHLHNGILCSRKKELLPFMTAWMELESTMLREKSQVSKDKHHMIYLYDEPTDQNKQISKIEPEAWK